MLKNNLLDAIVVKTKTGDFKLLKKGQLEELPSDDLSLPQDDLVKHKLDDSSPAAKPVANFYFNVEDEHEVRKLSAKDLEDKNIKIREFIEDSVQDIIIQAGLDETAQTSSQLKSIILSHLKDVRSLAETKEALSRLASAGVIDQAQISSLIGLLEKYRDKVEQVIKTGNVPARQRPLPTRPKVDLALKEKVAVPQKPLVKQKIEYKKEPEVAGSDQISKHIITGPVEEIQNLSLQDFRHLGTNPAEAADRVLEKINLLEDESLIKKDEGVKAWQQSEIYKLYLMIGAASLAEKKSVEQVVAELQMSGKPYLTVEEFNEVADLNRRLSY